MKRRKSSPQIGQLVRLKKDYNCSSLPLWQEFTYSHKLEELSSRMSLNSLGLIIDMKTSTQNLLSDNEALEIVPAPKELRNKLGIQLLSSEGGVGWNYGFYFELVE